MTDLIIQPGEKEDSPFTLFVMGPTATGKTDLAIAVYHEMPTEIISVDSALVYRGLDIGSAKPDKATLADAPHHLIDFIDPAENYSAGQFRHDALALIHRSIDSHRLPVLVGGTMLYFNALQKGMADLPDVDKKIRQKVEQETQKKGLAVMHRRLQQVDPQAAERIHPNDPQRNKRALEIYESSGITLSAYWQQQTRQCFPCRVIKVALVPLDRILLRQRITQRFDQMIQRGLIEEVKQLRQRGNLNETLPAIRAVGYRQVWAYLDGKYDFNTMREKAIIATAQLAKRQMTWLRKEENCNFIDPSQLNTDKILKKIRTLLS